MQAAGPIDGNVTLFAIETSSAFHAATSTDAAEFKQAVEDGAIVAHVVFSLLPHEAVHVVRGDFLQKLDVFVGMELRHLRRDCRFGSLLR